MEFIKNMEKVIRKYIVEEIMFQTEEDYPAFDTPLLEDGIIDSMGLQMLLLFLEEKFNVALPDEELVPENFETIQKISDFVKKYMNSR